MSADAGGQSQLLVGASKLHGTIKNKQTNKQSQEKCLPITAEVRRRLSRHPDLKELLDDVIPEHVGHQLVRRLQDFSKHHLPLGRRRPFQLLLDEPARSKEEKCKTERVYNDKADPRAEMQVESAKVGMHRYHFNESSFFISGIEY